MVNRLVSFPSNNGCYWLLQGYQHGKLDKSIWVSLANYRGPNPKMQKQIMLLASLTDLSAGNLTTWDSCWKLTWKLVQTGQSVGSY